MFIVELAPRRKRKHTSGIMLDRLTKSKGGRMEIHFKAGLNRPRDATKSAKLVSKAAVDLRCHTRILPTWIQYRNDKDKTQFNAFLSHLSVRMLFFKISNIVLLYPILSRLLVMRLIIFNR
jgi:hypothetical protein